MDSSRSPTDALLGEVAFVHRLARALLRDAGLAHDVAQDALTAALHAGPSRHVRGWLAAVTRHLAGRTGRDARERAAREANAARPNGGDGEARTAERLRLHRRLTDAVLALPEPYRTAVTLRFLDELTPRAIARRLQLPAATVRQHVHRGLAMLRQRLDGELGSERNGRDGWRGAFAAVGLGKTTVSVVPWLVPVLAMKKVVLGAAVAAVAVVGWWTWPRSDAPPLAAQAADSPQSRAAVAAASDATRVDDTKVDAVRTAATASAPRDEAFVVRVVDEREQPIAGAEVHRWTAAGALAKQRTDRDGRVEFAALDESGGVLVRANGWTPLVRELHRLRGETRCALPDGAILDGRMLVDGVPAPAGLRLGISAPLALPGSVPRKLREAIPEWRPCATTTTTTGGAFVFRGLAADRRVGIELPPTHWFLPEDVSEEGRQGFNGRPVVPARGVVLQTTQLPSVFGRAAWADDGSPVRSPEIIVYACFGDGDNSPAISVAGNEDGTFAAGFYPGSNSKMLRWRRPEGRSPLISAWVVVEAPGSNGSVRVDLDEKGLASMPIEVRLPRAAVTHFVVTDLDDKPIAGARVSATPSTVTDERGRGTFQGKRDRVLVGADGYQVQPARSHSPAAGSEADPLRFRLAARNHLVLTVRSEAGGVPPVRFVRIVSKAGDLFCGKRFHNSFDNTFGGSAGNSSSAGRPRPDGTHESYEWCCTARPDEHGRIELHSLEPGVPCTVVAKDSYDTELASASFVMPEPGETRTVELLVTKTPRTLRGRVVARDGTPIANVKIQLNTPRGWSNEMRTGADGAFTFAGVYARTELRLEAKLTGYADTEKVIASMDEAEVHVLVLDPGQRVTLRVVDEQGQPVESGARAEQVRGRSLHPQTLPAGEHVFTDLPPGIVTFEVAFGGSRFRVQHDTANPSALLRVPRPARIAVGPLKDGRRTDNHGVRATQLDGAGEPFWLRIGATDEQAELVVPGRHRVELIRTTWRGEGEQRERVEEIVAPAQEVEAKAGQLVRVIF